LHASLSVPSLFAARQRSATGGVGTLGEDPAVIRTILAFLEKKGVNAADSLLPDCRASPGLSSDLLI
jgi:hypothetical protein